MADSIRRYTRKIYLIGKGTVGGGLSVEELSSLPMSTSFSSM